MQNRWNVAVVFIEALTLFSCAPELTAVFEHTAEEKTGAKRANHAGR
jgi:hypothetical protein